MATARQRSGRVIMRGLVDVIGSGRALTMEIAIGLALLLIAIVEIVVIIRVVSANLNLR